MTKKSARAKDKGLGGVGTGVSGGQYAAKVNTAPGATAQLHNPHGLEPAQMERMRAEVDAAETELKEYGRVTMKALSRMTRAEYGPNPIFRKRRVADARAAADVAAYEEQQARIRLNDVHMRHEAEVAAARQAREGQR